MTDHTDPLKAAIERVSKFVELRAKAQGLDPDVVHTTVAKETFACLTLSDLRLMRSALTAPRTAANADYPLGCKCCGSMGCEACNYQAGAAAKDEREAVLPAPAGKLHDDGYFTWNGMPPHEASFAGWRADFYTAEQFRAALSSAQQERQEPVAGQWVRCTPDLINAGVSCAHTPRRPGDGTYSHDHFIAFAAPVQQEAKLEVRLPERVIDTLWQAARLSTYHPRGDQLEKFYDFAHRVTAEVLARIPSPPQAEAPKDHFADMRNMVGQAGAHSIPPCKQCVADRAKEDCKGDRLNCGLRGIAQTEAQSNPVVREFLITQATQQSKEGGALKPCDCTQERRRNCDYCAGYGKEGGAK